MRYTVQEVAEIMVQLMKIRVRDQQVFIVWPDESSAVHTCHGLYVDSGPTMAKLEFEKAYEPAPEVDLA